MPFRTAAKTVGYATNALDIWVWIGKISKQSRQYIHIYGYTGLVLPGIMTHDVFTLVQQVLNSEDDSIVQGFVSKQVDGISSLATTGSILASLSLAGLSKDYIHVVHWSAKAFMLSSLLSALFCVVYTMRLERKLGTCITADKTRAWLRSPPDLVWCRNKNRPSVSTVLSLDAPRTLVAMAVVSFLMGFSLYVVFVFVWGLDTDGAADASQNAMIWYFVSLWFVIAVSFKSDYFTYATARDDTWVYIKDMRAAIRDLAKGHDMEEWDEEALDSELGPAPSPPRPPKRSRHSQALKTPPPPPPPVEMQSRSDISVLSLEEALDSAIATRQRATEADILLIRALELLRDDMRIS